MANADGSILISTKVDQKGINTGLNSISKSLGKLAEIVGVAFGVSAIVKFGKEAVNMASDLQEVQNVVDTAFGAMSYKMEQFADTAIENFGFVLPCQQTHCQRFHCKYNLLSYKHQTLSESH